MSKVPAKSAAKPSPVTNGKPHIERGVCAIEKIERASYNPRTISPEAKRGLTESISRFGLVQEVVVNRRAKGLLRVVSGHQRLDILTERGEKEVPVVYVDLPDAEEKALNIALNSSHISGDFTDGLQAILDELKASMPEAYSALQLDKLIADLKVVAGQTDPDDIPEPPDKAQTKLGDRIVMGEHVLFCGDSGNRDHLTSLLAGAPIHLVNTDPPYNVKVEPRSNNAIRAGNSSFPLGKNASFDAKRKTGPLKTNQMRAKDRPLDNDNISDEDFAKRLLGWFGNITHALQDGRSFYIWGGGCELYELPCGLEGMRAPFFAVNYLDQGLACA